MNTSELKYQQLLTQQQVCEKVALSRVTIWKLYAQGDFPAPVITPIRNKRWRASEIDLWINSLPTANDKETNNVH